MTTRDISIGTRPNKLHISDDVRTNNTIVFDITGDFHRVCSDLSEGQAREVVTALIAAFPSLAELQYVVPTFEARTTRPVTFMGMDLAAGPDSSFTLVFEDAQPEPKIDPDGVLLHDPILDKGWDNCSDQCYAARASQRLYGDPSHAVSKAQVAKQRERDAQGLDTPKWDGISHDNKFCRDENGRPHNDCVYFRFGYFPREPRKSL